MSVDVTTCRRISLNISHEDMLQTLTSSDVITSNDVISDNSAKHCLMTHNIKLNDITIHNATSNVSQELASNVFLLQDLASQDFGSHDLELPVFESCNLTSQVLVSHDIMPHDFVSHDLMPRDRVPHDFVSHDQAAHVSHDLLFHDLVSQDLVSLMSDDFASSHDLTTHTHESNNLPTHELDSFESPMIDDTELNVEEFYQVLGRDVLRSSLLNDIELYLECEDDNSLATTLLNNVELSHPIASTTTLSQPKSLSLCIHFPASKRKAAKTRCHCDACNRTFTCNSLLNNHKHKVHGIKELFRCSHCCYQGDCRNDLRKHHHQMHGDLDKMGLSQSTSVTIYSLDECQISLNDNSFAVDTNNRYPPTICEGVEVTTVDRIYNCDSNQHRDVVNQLDITTNHSYDVNQSGIITHHRDEASQPDVTTCYRDDVNQRDMTIYDRDEVNHPDITTYRNEVNQSDITAYHRVEANQTDITTYHREVNLCINGLYRNGQNNDNSIMKDHRNELPHQSYINNVTKDHRDEEDNIMTEQRHIQAETNGILTHSTCANEKNMFSAVNSFQVDNRQETSRCATGQSCVVTYSNHQNEINDCSTKETLPRCLPIAVQHLYICEMVGCHRTFKSNRSLTEHIVSVHGDKTFRCPHPDCAASYSLARRLRLHAAKHSTTFGCTWPDCTKTFRDQYNRDVHYRVHTGEKTRQCPYCQYTCIQKNALDWHLVTKHKSVKP